MDVPPGSGVDAALVPPPPPPPPADASPAVEAAAASAPAAPPAAPSTTPAVPVLKGVVSVVGARYVFRGVWAMAEADSVVSDFEYVSRDLVSAASSAAAAAAAAASAVVANGDKAGLDINGAHADAGAGAGSDAVAADTVPPNGEYDGFFMLKRVGLPELKVEERGMLFRWTRPAVPPLVPAGVEPPPPSTDAPASVEPSRASPTAASGSESESESEQPPPPPPPADGGGVPAAAPAPVSASAAAAVVSPRPQSTIPLPGDFSFFASGSNIFGSFDLCGRYDPVSRQLVCSKVYTALPPTSPLAIIGKPSKSRKSSSKKRSGGEPRPRPVGPPRPKVVKPPPPVTPVLVDMAATPTPMLGDDMLTDAQREHRRRIPSHVRDIEALLEKLPGALGTCAKILQTLMTHQFAEPFLVPVDPVALNIPDYFKIIRNPMDLGTVWKKLESNAYVTHDEFAQDVRTTFANAITYNPPSSAVYSMAERLRKKFDEQWRLLSRQMDKEAKAEARALAGADVVMKPVKDSKRDGERGRKHSPGERMKTPKAEKKRPTSSDKAAAKAAAKAARAEERRRKRSRPSSDSTDSGQHRRSNGGGGGGGGGVDQSILEEMKNEMAALRMQLKRMAEMSTNATVGSAGVKMGELTFDEKRELSTRINQLDADKLARVVQIIAERMPLGSHSTSEDIEIDIDSLDVVTLRKLQDFVKVSLPKPKRAAPTAKKKEDLVKQVAAVTHANKERMKALQMASGHPRAMVDDSESSDDEYDNFEYNPPPPPAPYTGRP